MSSDNLRAVGTSGLGPGTVLDGKYEILSRIGAGGMGEVFKARHLHLDAYRCIKVMKQELLVDDLFRTRFLREARLATQIHHPNIAVVHDFFIGEGGNYMVTEFIEGRTLRQWSSQYGPFPLPLAADVASQVLAGLEHIHRRGLLHRDISPDNVMLSFDSDERCIAKIIDLGIAKDLASGASADTTQAGMLIGNPKYMSPEQLGLIADDEQIDGRTDLYSLGVVLYEIVAGVPPFASDTPHGYIMKHLTQAPRPHASIPPPMESVIFRALEKDRVKRFTGARDFAAALAPFLDGPAGTLTREDVARLRNDTTAITVSVPIPTVAVNVPTTTTAKERAFELALLDEVKEREKNGDRDGLQRLGQGHPRGTRVGDAAREALARVVATQERAAEAELAFQRAWEDGRSSQWRDFLGKYRDSARAEEARRLAAEAEAFERASESDSEVAVRQFLQAWPDARHHLDAALLLSKFRQRAAKAREEPADFERAWESGTSAAWDRYLAEHPQSPRLGEARGCRQEALDFELATATNTPAMWRAFIKTWPEGRHRIEAEIRMR
ncbi:MAG TPA: serine/threonine-protein kinase [Thermoanaerobaculia bacterium]|jgi:serine/threonine protein kinase|nr:serine/threonine-protein kinase [Thermoanaerobaculia bacterium]